jgi:hypothetical protein
VAGVGAGQAGEAGEGATLVAGQVAGGGGACTGAARRGRVGGAGARAENGSDERERGEWAGAYSLARPKPRRPMYEPTGVI